MPKPKTTKTTKIKLSSVVLSESTEPAVAQLPDNVKMVDYITLFKLVIEKHKNAKKWENGSFVGIKILSNTKVGSVGQDFIEELCGALKIPIVFPVNKKSKRASQSPWDIKLNNITFELKTATEDVGGKFQLIILGIIEVMMLCFA